MWGHTGSNRGPSACKADALNQLSYTPLLLGMAKIAELLKYTRKTLVFLRRVGVESGCPHYNRKGFQSKLKPFFIKFKTEAS